MSRSTWRRRAVPAATALAATILGLTAAELALRVGLAGPALVWAPGDRAVFAPDPAHIPGVAGPARFVVNEAGLRGDPLPPEPAYQILALGGSTTECVVLDTHEAWPALLQERLADALGRPVWVGNAGRSGTSLRHHLPQAELLLERLSGIDAIVVMVGGNDLLRALGRRDAVDDWYADPRERVRVHYEAFEVPSRPRHGPLLERTELVRLARMAKQSLAHRAASREDPGFLDGRQYAEARLRRQRAPKKRRLPALESPLASYQRDLERLIVLAREHEVDLFLVTQPALWRPDLPAPLEDLLWLGAERGGHPEAFYSAGALARGMARFNAELLAACSRHALPCLDLAGRLPPDTTTFYDDLHFNESGARRVAEAMTAHIRRELGRGSDAP